MTIQTDTNVNLAEPCKHGHTPNWRLVDYRKKGIVRGKTRACRTCERLKYVPKPLPHAKPRRKKRLSAEEANTNGVACKRGHCNEWIKSGITRACRRCRMYEQVRRLYGLTVEQAEALYTRAAGKCEACGRVTKLCIDHCHASLAVRGLLCTRCNNLAGALEHPVAELVLKYLKAHTVADGK